MERQRDTTYLLPCPCGKEIAVSPTQAGFTTRCTCGAELQVPPLREMVQLQQAPTSATAARKATWGRRESLIMLGAVVTVAALGLAFYLQLTRPRLADTDSMSLVQTWVLWQELRRGVDRNRSPLEEQYVEALKVNRLSLSATLVLAAAGAILMAVMYLKPRGYEERPPKKARSRKQSSLLRQRIDVLRTQQGNSASDTGKNADERI